MVGDVDQYVVCGHTVERGSTYRRSIGMTPAEFGKCHGHLVDRQLGIVGTPGVGEQEQGRLTLEAIVAAWHQSHGQVVPELGRFALGGSTRAGQQEGAFVLAQ